MLVCQMFHISQTTTVTDYVERFSTLFDQLKAYQPNPDYHYYTTCFVDGLRDDIRAVVTLKRPSSLDTAYCMALLQEEVADSIRKTAFRGNVRNIAPRVPVAEKPGDDKAAVTTPKDKFATLRSYRRARGLCERCAEKWVRGHKCAPTVQLHAIQEIWDMLCMDDQTETTDDSTEQLCLALSHDARMGSQTHRTISFSGSIQGTPIVVLVDSGSSVSFLSSSVAALFPQLPRAPMLASVKVANGQLLHCHSSIPSYEFSLGEYTFQHDLRILQLDSYDLILGMD